MSILGALKRQTESIDDLAKLPQAMIMQMAQKGQIREDMLAPILGRKAEMADAIARMQALQGAGQTPPTVMEQLMQTNAMAEQPEMETTGVAQLPVPEREYAGGGIIAFDEGGDVEDDEEDRIRKSRMESFGVPVEQLYAMLSNIPSKVKEMIPQSFTTERAKAGIPVENAPATASMPAVKKGSHKYEDLVIQEATRQGVDPRLAVHVLYKETGNLANPESAKSKAGALGVMQLMPGTAKELGVNPLDPMENIQGGISYLKKMYAKYQDPALAAAAYNAGPGRLDRALRSEGGIGNLPRETRNYMVGLASGGEVKHFQYGGSTMGGFEDLPPDDIFVPRPDLSDVIDPASGQKLFSGYSGPSKKKETAKKETAASAAPALTPEEIAQYTNPPKAAERDLMAEIIAQRKEDREAIKKSAAEDRNLALLAAGLGMLGGTSPYAFTNIGAGGAKGVETLAASKARRAAELSALNKSEVEGLFYGEEIKRRNLAQQSVDLDRARDNFKNYNDRVLKSFFMEGVPRTAKQEEAYTKFISTDPIYQQLYKDARISNISAPRTSVIKYNPQTRSLGQ
jgi:hypothetical protein